MLISEYLRLRNQISVSTEVNNRTSADTAGIKPQDSEFAQALREKLGISEDKKASGVEFSKHAIERLSDRNVDLAEGNLLERLNKGVEIAQGKGSGDTLVLVDTTAFIVSVKNNKVITTLTQDDLKGNIFTNIDSTVII